MGDISQIIHNKRHNFHMNIRKLNNKKHIDIIRNQVNHLESPLYHIKKLILSKQFRKLTLDNVQLVLQYLHIQRQFALELLSQLSCQTDSHVQQLIKQANVLKQVLPLLYFPQSKKTSSYIINNMLNSKDHQEYKQKIFINYTKFLVDCEEGQNKDWGIGSIYIRKVGEYQMESVQNQLYQYLVERYLKGFRNRDVMTGLLGMVKSRKKFMQGAFCLVQQFKKNIYTCQCSCKMLCVLANNYPLSFHNFTTISQLITQQIFNLPHQPQLLHLIYILFVNSPSTKLIEDIFSHLQSQYKQESIFNQTSNSGLMRLWHRNQGRMQISLLVLEGVKWWKQLWRYKRIICQIMQQQSIVGQIKKSIEFMLQSRNAHWF